MANITVGDTHYHIFDFGLSPEMSDAASPDREQVKACKTWLKAHIKQQLERGGVSARGLTDIVSNDVKLYIEPGALMQAAYELGITIVPRDNGTTDALLRVKLNLKPPKKNPQPKKAERERVWWHEKDVHRMMEKKFVA